MLRTVKGQGLVLLGWKPFVSVFLYFHSAGRVHPQASHLAPVWLGGWLMAAGGVQSFPHLIINYNPKWRFPSGPQLTYLYLQPGRSQLPCICAHYSGNTRSSKAEAILCTGDPISPIDRLFLLCSEHILSSFRGKNKTNRQKQRLEKSSSGSTRYHLKVIPKPWEKKTSDDGLGLEPFWNLNFKSPFLKCQGVIAKPEA